jgi:hypothetical protein
MSSNLIPFENNSLVPDFMRQDSSNSDLAKHMSAGFSSISIKGKVFSLVKTGERKVIPNPRDPESPATFIDIVLLKVSPNKSKSYYANGFNENAEDQRPTCYSNNGITPDPSVEHPQCKCCATCPHNAWGSARGVNGTVGKGKACADYVRVALAEPTNLDEPIMLRVPPASIRAIGDYGALLNKHKAPYQGVITRIAFEPKEATPRLVFTPRAFLDQETYLRVKDIAESELVSIIVNGEEGSAHAPAQEAPIPPTPVTPVKPAPMPAPTSAAEAQADAVIAKVMDKPREAPTKIEPVAEVKPVEAEPKVAPKAEPKEEPKVAETADDLGALLSGLGFDQ